MKCHNFKQNLKNNNVLLRVTLIVQTERTAVISRAQAKSEGKWLLLGDGVSLLQLEKLWNWVVMVALQSEYILNHWTAHFQMSGIVSLHHVHFITKRKEKNEEQKKESRRLQARKGACTRNQVGSLVLELSASRTIEINFFYLRKKKSFSLDMPITGPIEEFFF